MKRSHSPISDSSEINSRNRARARTMPLLSSLTVPVSPPQRPKKALSEEEDGGINMPYSNSLIASPGLAAVEAGQVKVEDHLKLFATRLTTVSRPLSTTLYDQRLAIKDWVELYSRNQHSHGCHFVIHQHDHPIAGLHYDLRLQFSESSSLSWAIMYGLPGNPNSRRLNRNATETRVHCFWVGAYNE